MQQSSQQLPTRPTKHERPKAHPERITQLQCLDSNSELQLFFIQALNESFKYLPTVLEYLYQEIQLLVGLVEYRFTIAVGKPHPGDSLQNIRYNRQGLMTPKIKILYLVLTVILPYLKRKIYSFLSKDPMGWKQKVITVFNFADKILAVLNLINSSIFIRYGKYRTLTQRILRLPMQFIETQSTRILDFSLMNRKIIWTVYELFLKTVLPFTHDLFGSTLKNIFYLNSYLQTSEDHSNACMYCQDQAKMPMKATSCQHLACYYCFSVNGGTLEASERMDSAQGIKKDKRVTCRACGVQIQGWKKLF